MYLFQDAIERSPLPLIETEGAAHVVRYANPAFARLCGQPAESILGRPLVEAVRACRADGSSRLLDEVLHTGGVVFGKSLAHPNPSDPAQGPAYWSYVIWPALDAEARITGLTVQVTDTTADAVNGQRQDAAAADMRDANSALIAAGIRQQELAEQAQRSEATAREATESLDRQTRLFNTTLSGISDFAYIFDRAGRFAYVNAPLLRLWGLDLEDAVGKDFYDLGYPAELAERLQRQIDYVFRTGRPLSDETAYTSPSGVPGYYEYIFRPVFGSDGRVEMVAGSTRDMTERRSTEEKLRASEERFRTLVEQVKDYAIFSTDTEGRATTWNEGVRRILGFEEAEFIGADIVPAIFTPEDVRAGVPQQELRTAAAEGSASNDRWMRRKDGTRFWASGVTTSLRDESGELTGFTKVMRDTTAAKRAEEALREQDQEMQGLNARLRRAMAETHHRVKNNLQVVCALVDMQMTKEEETVPASELARIGQHIRALAAVHDLLTNNSKGSGTGGAERLNTAEMMGKLAPLLQAVAQGRRLAFRVADMDIPLRMGTSLAMLTSELVSNAVKHGSGDIEVTLAAAPDAARLEVCDDGPGFPQGFDPREAANTGLELIESLSRWDLRGTTEYQSRAKGGARVVVEFPIPNEPALSLPASISGASSAA